MSGSKWLAVFVLCLTVWFHLTDYLMRRYIINHVKQLTPEVLQKLALPLVEPDPMQQWRSAEFKAKQQKLLEDRRQPPFRQ